MDLPAFLGAMRPTTSRVSRIRAVPRQLIKPSTSDLVRTLVDALNDCIRPAVYLETETEFSRHVEHHIEAFVALVMALATQIRPTSEPPPRLNIGPRLMELLGDGADVELEFCEHTLWSALRRASEEQDAAERQRIEAQISDVAMVAIFVWAILAAGGRSDDAHPVAMRAALRLLREAALETATVVSVMGDAVETSTPELTAATFDAEDAFLAMDPDA